MKHIRKNTECGATEELKPIDNDPYYDFNYQQFNNLPEPVHLRRGDSLILQCVYSTKNKRNSVTLVRKNQTSLTIYYLLYRVAWGLGMKCVLLFSTIIQNLSSFSVDIISTTVLRMIISCRST